MRWMVNVDAELWPRGHMELTMPCITLAQYLSIPADYRYVWEGINPNNASDMKGRRTAFSGSLHAINPDIPYCQGTTILFDRQDFLIIG